MRLLLPLVGFALLCFVQWAQSVNSQDAVGERVSQLSDSQKPITRSKRQADDDTGDGMDGDTGGDNGGDTGGEGGGEEGGSKIDKWVNKVKEWFETGSGTMEGIGQGVDAVVKIANMYMTRQQAKVAAERYKANQKFKLEELCDKICVTGWSQWSLCTRSCGGGTTTRTRTQSLPGQCRNLAGFTCRHSTKQTRHCNVACPNGAERKASGGCKCQRGFTGHCCTNNVVCLYPGKPRYGTVIGKFPARYGTVANYRCAPGFALIGTDELICKETGKWSGRPPKCERVKCRMPSEPRNGQIINRQTVYRHSEDVVFICNDGYKLLGPTKRQCVSYEGTEGKWTGFTPMCRPVSCGDPGIPIHGEREGINFRLGGKVTYRCARGFRLEGSKVQACLPSGKWSGHAPQCKLMRCDDPYIPPNSRLVRTRKEYRYGHRIVYECRTGYNMKGGRTLQCIEDKEAGGIGPGGKWNASAPVCKAAICGNPGTPKNGAKDGSIYYYPHNVTFSCFAGYVIRGAPRISCQTSGKWSSTIPKCEACKKGYYKDNTDRAAECKRCPSHTHTVTAASTSKQQCVCDRGYKGPAGGPCTEITCPVLSAPQNGSISQCGNKLDNSCDFNCIDGYILDRGSSRRTCQASGDWTGKAPTCTACPKDTFKADIRSCLPCPRHSRTNSTGNMKDACICNNGYRGPNGGPCADVNECLTNGKKGPCQDVCENNDGGYKCRCSTPGHVIDPLNGHTCKVNRTCRNLTIDDAPRHGGLVCHWYKEMNSQQCGVRCNPGYEFPARTNNYESCGPNSNFIWSHEERKEKIEPCIEEFFPDFRLEANSTYFVRECNKLTEKQKEQVKKDFADLLTKEGICKKRRTKVCDMKNVGIICGRTRRRRKRGVDEVVDEVDFSFDIHALKVANHPKNCTKICAFLRIPANRCSSLCFRAFKRFLKAAVMYSRRKLQYIFKRKYKVEFVSVNRKFEPGDDPLKTSGVIIQCDPGSKAEGGVCVPCTAGTFYSTGENKCVKCKPGYYQSKQKQFSCRRCPPGYMSLHHGAVKCKPCPKGKYGQFCHFKCECVNGTCDKETGKCECASGWTGAKCDIDIPGCLEGSCFDGVNCTDVPAPGTGFHCGACPLGFSGDGARCSREEGPSVRALYETLPKEEL